MKLLDTLQDEHVLIDRVLGSLRTYVGRLVDGTGDPADGRRFASFFTEFAGHFHHDREERVLFRALVTAAELPADRGPVYALAREHAEMEEWLRELAPLLERRPQSGDDRARVNDAFGQSLETRTPYEIVHRLQMPDGRIKYVQCRSQTFFDDEGRPQRVMGTVQDITARKRIEEALGASEERFRAAYRNATVGMSFADQYGRIHEVNQALCTILGYSEQELLTLTFQAVTHPDDLDHSLDRVRGGCRDLHGLAATAAGDDRPDAG